MLRIRKFLFENEAVIGINSPTDYLYLKIVRFTLAIIRSWPHKEIGEYESKNLTIFLKYFYLCSFLVFFGAGITYFVIHFSSLAFLELGHIFVTLFLNVVDLSRIITLTISDNYREMAKDFITKFHLFFYKDRSDYAMKTHKQVHLVSHLFGLYLTVQMISVIYFFNLIPMYNNYSSGKYKAGGLQNSTLEHSIYISYPFNVSSNMEGYIVACIINWIVSYLSSTWCCMFDLFLSVMVFHLWGHFKILINNLHDFPKPTLRVFMTLKDGCTISAEKYSQEGLLQVSNKLKECIDYHREILIFTDRLTKVFGPALFVYYMFQQTSGCILLLECAQMTAPALLRYIPLTFILFQQLIQLSSIFELVGSESEKLKNAVYGLPWECMDINNRKVVAFFLMNVQEPVHVKALGVTNVGVRSMTKILKTSLSYFTFLRSV